MYISAECRYSGRPSKHSLQNASAVQLGVSQIISGVAVMCKPAHERPVLPFRLCANNCRSEHIHRMLLSDVAVTTEQHQKENIRFCFGEEIYTKCLSFFFLLNLKYIQILNCVSFVSI
jgi:hypothetical protein